MQADDTLPLRTIDRIHQISPFREPLCVVKHSRSTNVFSAHLRYLQVRGAQLSVNIETPHSELSWSTSARLDEDSRALALGSSHDSEQ